MRYFIKIVIIGLVFFMSKVLTLNAETKPLMIEITQGVIKPMPIALSQFSAIGDTTPQYVDQITSVIMADLVGSGLFREIPRSAHVSANTNFNNPVRFSDWRVINVDALITGSVNIQGDKLILQFRLFDVFAQKPLGEGLQFQASIGNWRRMAHKISDAVYSRLTGEAAYFDSRVVYISEQGPKNARKKRLTIMDYDGANSRFLTDDNDIVLAPRFSPNNEEIVYTSYETGVPKVYLMNVDTLNKRVLDDQPGMTFAPRFSPDGRNVVMSLTDRGNTDIYSVVLESRRKTRLTSGPSIDTAPSFSPDGKQIVFESDRGGRQQIYIMSSSGGDATRISFGKGSYGTPVWSPRGDMIAFTKISQGRFHIGVMRTDGSNERLLTASFLDEGPTWSPNGRVIMFFRESAGTNGAPEIFSVDVTGRNLKRVKTIQNGSDPSWSGLLK
ncbi:Tol-Pal system beta propeller repeat protein TolB [Amylibacter sp.]|jgi:TolB protein|nr:Tol-Pal system beta propeller repeat protein TolB [Amylibacter sp.]MDA9236815.1 Tol-Pal system beta propeller repeat protein TolB [Amylibacter sp.]MDA9278372.1 Tol-Pal system beta propeller repeat protein TolB [Amylibacter sp.]MDA9282809.1 Tol-Pal system beta propeller repeat protein TolB [Amylibacter sp.]MDA9370086.1 Tol-Pal system beta propeller repeat protein TolB [Amylibacter sp.]|tara:strand:+ start:836 stop:2161 length:1326 start_codon:yes stop_codon:yes gene_type:complete